MQRLVAILVLASLSTVVRAEDPPDLRLVHLRDGLRGDSGRGGLKKSAVYKYAQAAGVDLAAWSEPLLVHSLKDGRLFYLFYKTTENAHGDRPYLIQRIRKTERTWPTRDAEPEVRVTYQVEVFKTLAGSLKRADRHFGSFGLKTNARREIIKEYEIGFGEVPGVCEGKQWPYDPGILFHKIQPYGQERGAYDEVRFRTARRWTLRVGFDSRGTYSVASEELGFDAPEKLPAKTRPKVAARSKALVLQRGQGVGAFLFGEGTPADLEKMLGKPLEVATVGRGHTNYSMPGGLTVNFDAKGKANTVITRTDFGGRTAAGVGLWGPRATVKSAYGQTDGQADDARYWRYPGIIFYFDGFNRVERIVITKP